MEDNLSQVSKPTELTLNNDAISFLKETAKWTNFLAIMGFIGIGLLVIIALFVGTIFSALPEGTNPYSDIGAGVLTFIYLLMAALYYFPVMYLYRFANKMKVALGRNDGENLTAAFMNLKSHYKFVGILTIVMLGLYALLIILALIGGLAAM